MIGVLTRYRVSKGKEAAFETAFAALQQKVISKEPGTVAFQLYRAANHRQLYQSIAHFRDQACMEAHNRGTYLKSAAKELYAACDEPPAAEIFVTV